MKNFLVLSLVVLSVISTAQARSLHPETFTRSASLLTWDFDPSSRLAEVDILEGSIRVNAVTKVVKLTLQYPFPCPIGMICMQVIENEVIELPLTEVKRDGCGVVVYTAQKDKRPVDGALTEIIVRDNSRSVCEIIYPAMTTLEYNVRFYNRMTRDEVVQNSYLTAEKLSNL